MVLTTGNALSSIFNNFGVELISSKYNCITNDFYGVQNLIFYNNII